MRDSVKEIYQSVRAKRWLAAAIFVEALGLVGAVGSIPALGLLPLIWALAIVGILSTVGVLIVTAHYVWEYNRRPLNDAQRVEVEELLSPYFLSERAGALVPMSELSNFVRESELFWIWRYQNSVMEFAWESMNLWNRPGYILVAQLDWSDSLVRKIEFALLAPPIEGVGPCLSDSGEEVPSRYREWGTLFDPVRPTPVRPTAVVLYHSADRKMRYLSVDPFQMVLFDDRMASPVLVSSNLEARLPQLARIAGTNTWEWVMP